MHTGAEFVLKDDSRNAVDAIGLTCKKTKITLGERHVPIMDEYVRLIRAKRGADGSVLKLEQRVHLTEDCFGTIDSLLLHPKRMRAWDLKTGSGHIVFARDNWQLGIYGAAALKEYDGLYEPDVIELGISQPSLNHKDRVIHNFESLSSIGRQVEDTIDLIKNGKGVFVPAEDNCRWCPASPLCPTLKKRNVAVAMADFADVVDQPVKGQDDVHHVEMQEQAKAIAADLQEEAPMDWGRRLEIVSLLKIWCKAVEESTRSLLLSGKVPEGDSLGQKYKVVIGRSGNREFADTQRVIEDLTMMFDVPEDALFEKPTLKSPTQVEAALLSESEVAKAMKKKDVVAAINAYVSRAPGAPTVVTIGDPREPVSRFENAVQDFAELDESDAE